MDDTSSDRTPSAGVVAAGRRMALRASGWARADVRARLRRVGMRRSLRTRDTAYAGLVVTAVVVALTWLGALQVPEQWLYDLRTRFCQWGRPAPTDQLVHVDMDSSAITDIGRWPWPRATQAALYEELAAAGPKAVAIDILYSELEKPTIEETERVGEPPIFTRIDNDALLEEALRKLPGSIIGFSHDEARWPKPTGDAAVYARLVEYLKANPRASEQDAVAAIAAAQPEVARRMFVPARREAIDRRVAEVFRNGQPTLPELLQRLGLDEAVPGGSQDALKVTSDPIINLVASARQYELELDEVHRHRIPATPESIGDLYPQQPDILPLVRFSRAAYRTGFVTYFKGGDGSMRNVPIIINDDGNASVSLGLALALATLDVPLANVRIEPDKLVIPTIDRTIEVPLRNYRFNAETGNIGGVLPLVWFGEYGKDAWLTMYARGDTQQARSEKLGEHNLSMAKLWGSILIRRRIAENNAQLRLACLTMQGMKNAADSRLEQRTYDPQDATAWTSIASELLAEFSDDIKALVADAPKDPGPPVKGFAAEQWRKDAEIFNFYRAATAAEPLIKALNELGTDAAKRRQELAHQLRGKAVLVGWTATGRTDFVTTPLHSAAPGVRIHGVVFNSIITGNFLRFAPEWMTLAVTALLGLLTTLVVVRLSPGVSLLGASCISTGFTALNATLFAYQGLVLGLAGPLTAVIFCWSYGALARYVIDRAERNRILKRFQTYVDPQLVNYVLAHPDRNVTAGERRNITVCFTDLAGFTTLSERLGEKTVELLNEYFGVMIPVIRKHGGYLNKLLGDGMMFFFNAPLPRDNHTHHAFDSVLELQRIVIEFNESLESRGLPHVKMRVGITRGDMIAGDAGGDAAAYSDYTVLGDAVNLASRLEGANKATGTLIIVNAEARDAGGDAFLTRPIGVLQVVGKTTGVEAYELMCRRDAATLTQVQLAKATEQMIDAYRAGKIEQSLQLAHALEARFGESKLSHLYITRCEELLQTGLPEGFNGTIVLDSK